LRDEKKSDFMDHLRVNAKRGSKASSSLLEQEELSQALETPDNSSKSQAPSNQITAGHMCEL